MSIINQVYFWGTRGSLPVSLNVADIRQRLSYALKKVNGRTFSNQLEIDLFIESLPFNIGATFGGASSCVEIIHESNEHIICDMGSGALNLGEAKIIRYGRPAPQIYHIFISHLHWDHLLGLPFFEPMYIAGNQVYIHGCHPRLEEAFRLQMRAPCFPLDYSQIGAKVKFNYMEVGKDYQIANLTVSARKQLHPGDSFAYRFIDANGKTVVYATDAEYPFDQDSSEQKAAIEFFRNADILIFDATFTLSEAMDTHVNWGHSCNIIGAELSLAAAVKKLILFHHDPKNDDLQLKRLLDDTKGFIALNESPNKDLLEVISAYDGLIVNL